MRKRITDILGILLRYCKSKNKTGKKQKTFLTPLYAFLPSGIVAAFVIFLVAVCTFVIYYTFVMMPS